MNTLVILLVGAIILTILGVGVIGILEGREELMKKRKGEAGQ